MLYREQRTPHFLDSSAIAYAYICIYIHIKYIYVLKVCTAGKKLSNENGKIAKITIFVDKQLALASNLNNTSEIRHVIITYYV